MAARTTQTGAAETRLGHRPEPTSLDGRAVKTAFRFALRVVSPVVALAWLAGLAMLERMRRWARPTRSQQARVIWGPIPLINNKYWSNALRQYGFKSSTLAYGVYPAFRREDFDHHLDEFRPRSHRLWSLAPYFAFAWCLRSSDVFVFSYDGGYLAGTPLRSLECQLIGLAGKRIVMIPYGSDIAVPGTIGPAEAAVYSTYPDLLRRGDEIRNRVLYFCRHATFVVRTYQPGFQPRQDLLWPNGLGIDAEHWKPVAEAGGADARSAEVLIVHPTNHRSVKGTEFLIKAVDELQSEGLHLRLEIMEGRSNEDVRAAMATADIVAEQFIAGYGLTGVEAMALGRPVLSNLSWLGPEFWDGTYLRDCPIVNATPESLKEELRRVATHPELRASLGRAGREYVLKYHSAEAVGQIWKSIVSHVWLHEAIASKVSAEFLAAAETA